MYLHRDKELLKDIIERVADRSGRTPAVNSIDKI